MEERVKRLFMEMISTGKDHMTLSDMIASENKEEIRKAAHDFAPPTEQPSLRDLNKSGQ